MTKHCNYPSAKVKLVKFSNSRVSVEGLEGSNPIFEIYLGLNFLKTHTAYVEGSFHAQNQLNSSSHFNIPPAYDRQTDKQTTIRPYR